MPSQLKDRLKKASRAAAEPLWTGPNGEGPNGGVTQSMIGSWLVCRERFRVRYVLGLQPPDEFNHRICYGSGWHICEEHLAAKQDWEAPLKAYYAGLCKEYPMQQDQIQHWWQVTKAQFPVYVAYWKKHSYKVKVTSLLREQAFDVPYTLPSGRVVRLRGKWDGVELVNEPRKPAGIFLFESKTKGDVDEDLLRRQLKFDLQTMWYLIALKVQREDYGSTLTEHFQGAPILGVRYNVIRRPLSGGKGSIRKHQPTKSNPAGESDAEFYTRLQGIIAEEPGYWFMRWTSEVSPQDVERFKVQFLNPCLEQLCSWYDWVAGEEKEINPEPFSAEYVQGSLGWHFRLPYGVYSPLLDGRPSDLDAYLDEGSLGSLKRADRLFKELSDG